MRDLCRLTACLGILLLVCQGQGTRAADRTKSDPGEIVDRVEKELRAELMSAMQTNPTLNGTWIDLTVERDRTTSTVTGCAIKAILDEDPTVAKAQRAEIDRIAKRYLNDYRYRFEEIAKLPMHSILSKLNSRIDLNPRLAGAEVEAAYFSEFAEDDGQWKMTMELSGRVANDDHRSALTDLANSLFESDVRDSTFRIRTVTDKIRRVRKKGDGPAVAYCFNQGILHFGKRQYAAAYRFFTQAAREAPERIEFQYWRVASLLGNSEDADATTLLENLVKLRLESTKSSVMESVVARSLEPVQGPIRQRMTLIEKRAMCPNCE